MANSIESDRLQKLIDRKIALYKKMRAEDPDNPALKFLNSEITFLKDVIMPIILCNTVVDYMEIRNFVTKSMRTLESQPNAARMATDLLIHFHLKEPPEGKQPIVACMSTIGHRRQFMTEMFVDYKQALVYPLEV